MAVSPRCTICAGFLHHSYNTDSGICVYRCTGEDNWNDKGRFFIFAAGDVVEVEPVRVSKGSWTYSIVDTENRRRKKDSDNINADLEARQKQFQKSIAEMYSRASYSDRYAVKDD
jgi:hypothetical protein